MLLRTLGTASVPGRLAESFFSTPINGLEAIHE
jgi:hypothetical protein